MLLGEGVTPVYLPEGLCLKARTALFRASLLFWCQKAKELVFSVSDFSVVLLNVNEG